jgi:hypothetical protein
MAQHQYLIGDLIGIWCVFGINLATLIIVFTLSLRDIIKSSQAMFVLKDQYTVYFIVYLNFGLFFKLLVIDTYYKAEIEK